MKNQIIKFEKGGLSYLSPKWSSPPQQTKEEVESSKDDDGLSDIFNKLTGLPSDISALQDTMQNIVTDFNGNVSKSSAAYRYIVGKIAAATANKNLADQAIGFVKANDSMREYAITNNGGIFVYKNTDDGKRRLALISVKDFNPHKDLPAYVSDLINERSNNPQFANNNELLTTIGDSIGRSVVFKRIMDIVQNIKFSSDEGVGKDITDGIKKLTTDDADGTWAQTIEQSKKVVQSDKDPNILRASIFIFNTLSEKEKNLLYLIGKEQNLSISDIIENIIKSQSQIITKTDYDFVKLDSNKSGSGSGSGSGNENVKGTTATTQAYLLQHDIGERIVGAIKLGSTVLSTTNNGWMARDIYDKDRNIISGGSIKNILFNSQLSPAIDKNSIYFGNKKLSTSDLDYIAYKPNGYRTMYLPYKTDAQNNVTIDFGKWKQVEDAERELQTRGIKKSDTTAVLDVYKRHSASDMVSYAYANAPIKSDENPDGVTENQKSNAAEKLHKFIFFEGIAPQDALKDYGSGAIPKSPFANIYNLKWTTNTSEAESKKQEYLSTILNGADEDDKKLPQYLKNATKAVQSHGVESDMVASLIYAPVHRDFVNAGIASENIVTKKQLPDDRETNKTFTESTGTWTSFRP